MIVYTQSLHLSAMAEVAMDAVDAADGKVEFMITVCYPLCMVHGYCAFTRITKRA